MEAELDELLDKAQSIPQKVLGQARAARRRNLGIFMPRFPRSPQNWWKVRESLPNPLNSGLGVVGLGLRHVSDGLSNEGGRGAILNVTTIPKPDWPAGVGWGGEIAQLFEG